METKFEYHKNQLAHPGKRYQGQFIDGLIALLLFGVFMYLTKLLSLDGVIYDIVVVAVPFAYFLLSDALPNGQSLGKKVLGLYVVSKATGKPCKLWQSVARNLFSPILGIIDALFLLSKERQRLGDMLANTIVLKK